MSLLPKAAGERYRKREKKYETYKVGWPYMGPLVRRQYAWSSFAYGSTELVHMLFKNKLLRRIYTESCKLPRSSPKESNSRTAKGLQNVRRVRESDE